MNHFLPTIRPARFADAGTWAIRAAQPSDADAIWTILRPIIRCGEVFTLPRKMHCNAALEYWLSSDHDVFVAECMDGSGSGSGGEPSGEVIGTYFLRPNQPGAGSHVANCGYATALGHQGRGVARAMCLHSLEHARRRGYRAMQFNFVVATNDHALRLWQSCGFETIGRLPEAFDHPTAGYTDAHIMFRTL